MIQERFLGIVLAHALSLLLFTVHVLKTAGRRRRMWIFTTFGFFSVVQKQGSPLLTIRARVREDLDGLRERYLPSLSATITGAGTDYRYRATVSHEHLALAMAAIVRDIDYSNFKSEVARRQDRSREAVYHKVWDALWQLERIELDRA